MKPILRNLKPNHGTSLFFFTSFNVAQHLCDRELELSTNLNYHLMIRVPHLVQLEGEQMHEKNVQGKFSKCFCPHPGVVM